MTRYERRLFERFTPYYVIITYYVACISVLLCIIDGKQYSSNLSRLTSHFDVSSVWCHSDGIRKSCTFKNLCYAPKEEMFIFMLTDDSILSGIKSKHELKTIDLASVLDHNRFMMKLGIVTPGNNVLQRNRITLDRVFISWRFKWDNIMHVIHDDLLPLYTTYASICTGNVEDCVSKYKLVFADDGELGPLNEWYSIFSNSEPLLLHKGGIDNIICFNESQAGFISDSIWFQYGFGMPQGPITNSRLNGNQVRKFSEYVSQKFHIPILQSLRNFTNIILFSRKMNRKIINENELIEIIESVYRTTVSNGPELQIFSMDLATNDTKTILSHLIQSQVVVGMHGSAMILTMFSKPGSAVVELFPFGINPANVSPVKAMCDIVDIGLIYNFWVNTQENNTVVHPDAPALHGGITHLSASLQEEIMGMTEVPAVECCHNPAYLYRMFQDTIVGSDFAKILKNTLLKQQSFSLREYFENSRSEVLLQWYFPAVVTNVSCYYEPLDRSLTVTWTPPINTRNPEYQVAVVITDNLEFSAAVKEPQFRILIPLSVDENVLVDFWIKCVEQEEESFDTYAQCDVNI